MPPDPWLPATAVEISGLAEHARVAATPCPPRHARADAQPIAALVSATRGTKRAS